MNLAVQYIVVNDYGIVVGATGWDLRAAWELADGCDGSVAIISPTKITPVDFDGWPTGEKAVMVRPGVPDPVHNKVRHL